MQDKTNGFSLLELMAVILLLAILAAIVVPRIGRRPISISQQLMRELNNLTRVTQLSALMTNKLHRVFFDLKNNQIQAQVASGKLDSQGKQQFKPLSISYVKTSVPLKAEASLEKFYIKGKNVIQSGEGIQNTGAWFFVSPEGITQEVKIEVLDQKKKQSFSLAINPFTAQFKVQ